MVKKGAVVIEGHVQGLNNCRSLGEMGIPVYVCDEVRCLAQYSRYCTKHFICPPFKSHEFIGFLVDLAIKEGLKDWFLICSNDHVVENLSLHREELEQYYRFLVPDKENLYRIINKKNLLEVATTVGTNIPATCDADSIEKAKLFRFPLLVKGNRGLSFYKATHKKAIQVDCYEDLLSLLEAFAHEKSVDVNDVMIQELIPFDRNNKVVSFTCFAVNGVVKTYWMGRKLREHPVRYGTATCSQSILIADVVEEARPLVQALNYTGTCEIEFLHDPRDGKWKLIEINPRTWLWVSLAKKCGVDYAKIMYRYVQGEEQDYPDEYAVGIKWRNSLTDFFYGMKAVISKDISIKEYVVSLKGETVHAVWDWKDVLPGLIFPILLPKIAIKRR